MVQNKNIAYDLNRYAMPNFKPETKPKFKVIKSKKINIKPKSKVSLILKTITVFTILIILSYRYNLISEKNLELQRKNMELSDASSILATTEINLKQSSDLKYVENYAKQQLGMQKPEKSQIIYINADYRSEVTNNSNNNIFSKIIDSIKNIVK